MANHNKALNRTRPRVMVAGFVAATFFCPARLAPGAEFRIEGVEITPEKEVKLTFPSDDTCYYILRRAGTLQEESIPVRMTLGQPGVVEGAFTMPVEPEAKTLFYRIERVPLNEPKDTDGDGIDDVTELRNAAVLNPLDAGDGAAWADAHEHRPEVNSAGATGGENAQGPPASPDFDTPPFIDNFDSIGAFKVVLLDGTVIDAATVSGPTFIGRTVGFTEADEDADGIPRDVSGDPIPVAGGGLPPYPDTSSIVADPFRFPVGFPEGAPGRREVHTEILDFQLSGGGVVLRAGQAFHDSLEGRGGPDFANAWYTDSIGEVTSLGSGDFPADSFFNVFVEVEVPGPAGPLFLSNLFSPMVIRAERLVQFPPRPGFPQEVYIHDPNFPAVPLYLFWNGFCLHYGWLLSAGHGAGVPGGVLPGAPPAPLFNFLVSFTVDEKSKGIRHLPGFDGVFGNEDDISIINHVRDDDGTPEQQVTVYESIRRPPYSNQRVPELTGEVGPVRPQYIDDDAIVSLSFGEDGTGRDAQSGVLFFSVDRESKGERGSDVNLAASVPPPRVGRHPASIFLANLPPFGRYLSPAPAAVPPGSNYLAMDANLLGLRPLCDDIATSDYRLDTVEAAGPGGLPGAGQWLVLVALVGGDLHVRIFDAAGVMVVDKTESELIAGPTLTDLKTRLSQNPFPDESILNDTERQEIIDAATLIADYIDPGNDHLTGLEVDRFSNGKNWYGNVLDETGTYSGANIYVYNPRSERIQIADLDGTNPGDLVTGLGTLSSTRAVAVDDRFIYWADAGTCKIQRASLGGSDGSDVIDLVRGLTEPKGIAVTGSHLYWTDGGKISRVPLDWYSYSLQVLEGLGSEGDLPAAGVAEIIVADIQGVLHIRVFDNTGKQVVNVSEGHLQTRSACIAQFRWILTNLRSPGALDPAERETVVSWVALVLAEDLGCIQDLCGIAVTDSYLYWAALGAIGRAELNGPDVNGYDLQVMTVNAVGDLPSTGNSLVVIGCVGPNPPLDPGALHIRIFGPNGDLVADNDETELALGGYLRVWDFKNWIVSLPDVSILSSDERQAIMEAGALLVGDFDPDFISGLQSPGWITVSNAGIFWTDRDGDKIQRADLDGTNAGDLITGLGDPAGVAVTNQFLYWGNTSTQAIQRANLNGSGVSDVITGVRATGIAVNGSSLFWGGRKPLAGPFTFGNLNPSNPYAEPGDIGLTPFDNIDALVLSDVTPDKAGRFVLKPYGPNGILDVGRFPARQDEALFSLSRNSPSLGIFDPSIGRGYSPADIFYTAFDGSFSLFATAESLGLLPSDNISCADIMGANVTPPFLDQLHIVTSVFNTVHTWGKFSITAAVQNEFIGVPGRCVRFRVRDLPSLPPFVQPGNLIPHEVEVESDLDGRAIATFTAKKPGPVLVEVSVPGTSFKSFAVIHVEP